MCKKIARVEVDTYLRRKTNHVHMVRACVCMFTSKCLVASSLRDMSMSLVRMLRKCMSLRRVARFTVVSFVDCEDKRIQGNKF